MKEREEPEGKPSTDSKVTISRIDSWRSSLSLPASTLLWSEITQDQCGKFWRDHYSKHGVRTFDGIEVRFASGAFKHAFFESPGKVEFSHARAQRVRWIEPLLQDPAAVLLAGFDKQRGIYDHRRRVALWPAEAYLAVIQFDDDCADLAHFVTAFVLSGGTEERVLRKLLSGPRWPL